MPLYFATNHKVYCGKVKEDANGVTTQFPFDPNVSQTVHVKEIIEGQTGYVKYENTNGTLYCNEIIEEGSDYSYTELYNNLVFWISDLYLGNYQNNGLFLSNTINLAIIEIVWVLFDTTTESEVEELNNAEFTISNGQSTGMFYGGGDTTYGGGYIEFSITNNQLYYDINVSQGSGDYIPIPYVRILG